MISRKSVLIASPLIVMTCNLWFTFELFGYFMFCGDSLPRCTPAAWMEALFSLLAFPASYFPQGIGSLGLGSFFVNAAIWGVAAFAVAFALTRERQQNL